MPLPRVRPPLRLERLEDRENPAPLLPAENFDAAATLPTGWAAWSGDATGSTAVSAGLGVGGSNAVTSVGQSKSATRTWNTRAVDADTGAAVSVFADGLIPAVVFARGQNLNTTTPSYVAAVVTRGLTVELWEVTNVRPAWSARWRRRPPPTLGRMGCG